VKENRRRLKRITTSLSPTQAVCLWLTEAHQHGSLFAYTQWLLDQPDDSYPLVKMPKQVVEAVRTAMKGKPREDVHREIYCVQRDVLFLFHLAMGLNTRALELAETLRLKALLLAEQFHSLILRHAVGRETNALRLELCRELAYPLDPETAAVVEAAQKYGVETWELLSEAEVLEEWVRAQYVREGRIELPWGAHVPFADPASIPPPSFEVPTAEEIRALFLDEDAFQAFVEMTDHLGSGLADVPDAAFQARCDALRAALAGLVTSGEVQAGRVLRLDAVPQEYLADVPLVDEEWVDRQVLVLAEYGALLRKHGYEVRSADDDHPQAWSRVFREGCEVAFDELKPLLAEAEARLAKCPAEVHLIDDRPYLRLRDYLKWRGRGVKGNLKAKLSPGLVRESFNAWVRGHGPEGVAELAGVRVEEITDYATDYPVQVAGDQQEARLRLQVREELLGGLRDWSLSDPEATDWCWTQKGSWDRLPFRGLLAAWCGQAETLLEEWGQFSATCRLIERRYFAGHPVLYPEVAQMLENLREVTANLVELVNGHYVADWERSGRPREQPTDASDPSRLAPVDIARILETADGSHIARYLVDVAKAEALEKLGERGKAETILEPHLRGTP